MIAYYLQNREPVDEYVRQQEADADRIEQQVRAASAGEDFKHRLLERRVRKP